jgi:hypothetical protein
MIFKEAVWKQEKLEQCRCWGSDYDGRYLNANGSLRHLLFCIMLLRFYIFNRTWNTQYIC